MNQTIKTRIEQIGRGEVPEGYKKTKVGVIPQEWEMTRLSKYLRVNNDKNNALKYSKEDVFSISGELGIVNQIELLGRSYAGASVAPYGIVYPNNIVYTKSPLKANPYGIIKANKTGKTGIVSTLYAIYHCRDNTNSSFVEHYFRLDLTLNNYLYPIVNIGAKHDMKISDENALKGYVAFPSLAEQERIAEILGTQDKLIALKEKRIAEKKQQKKFLMQQLLTGKKRLPGFTGEWKSVKIGNSFKVISGYPFDSKNFTDSGVSVIRIQNIDNGVVNLTNSAKHNKFDICQYNVAYTGDVLIAMSGATTGKIGVYLGEEEAYINQRVGKFIVLDSNVVKKQYLIQILLSELFFDKLKVLLSTGAQPNIGSGDLEKMNFVIPMEAKEQQAIANILSQADKEIELLQKDLEEEKNKKKALMQLLLTGIVRVV